MPMKFANHMLDLILQINCKFNGNISSNKIVIVDIPIL